MFAISKRVLPGKVKKEEFFKQFEETAINIFNKNKTLEPVVAVLNVHGEVTLFDMNFDNDFNKSASIAFIKHYCVQSNIIMCCFGTEVWMAETDKDDEVSKQLMSEIGVSMMPNSQECLMLTFDSIENPSVGNALFNIERNGDDVSLTERSRDIGNMQGLMVNLLTKNFN